jgi:hypothetical protein
LQNFLSRNTKIKICRIVVIPVIPYGYETRFLKLMKEHNGSIGRSVEAVLRVTFGPRKEDVRGRWRMLQKEELHDLYCLPDFIRVMKSSRMRWEWHIARMGKMRSAYRNFSRKTGGEKPNERVILEFILKK